MRLLRRLHRRQPASKAPCREHGPRCSSRRLKRRLPSNPGVVSFRSQSGRTAVAFKRLIEPVLAMETVAHDCSAVAQGQLRNHAIEDSDLPSQDSLIPVHAHDAAAAHKPTSQNISSAQEKSRRETRISRRLRPRNC